MTITIKLNTDNAAFGSSEDTDLQFHADRDAEVSRILREWSARIPEDGYGAKLYDYNGNTVGSVTLTGK